MGRACKKGHAPHSQHNGLGWPRPRPQVPGPHTAPEHPWPRPPSTRGQLPVLTPQHILLVLGCANEPADALNALALGLQVFVLCLLRQEHHWEGKGMVAFALRPDLGWDSHCTPNLQPGARQPLHPNPSARGRATTAPFPSSWDAKCPAVAHRARSVLLSSQLPQAAPHPSCSSPW